jgi:hypothetical protein
MNACCNFITLYNLLCNVIFDSAQSSYQSLDFEADSDETDEKAPLLPKSKNELQGLRRRRCITGGVVLLLLSLLGLVPAAWWAISMLLQRKHIRLF